MWKQEEFFLPYKIQNKNAQSTIISNKTTFYAFMKSEKNVLKLHRNHKNTKTIICLYL